MFSCILYVIYNVLLHFVNFIWKQDHLTTLTYHNKYVIPMLYKILHGFADNPLHAVPQALAIASELAISLRRWSNIDNWHAECAHAQWSNLSITIDREKQTKKIIKNIAVQRHKPAKIGSQYKFHR